MRGASSRRGRPARCIALSAAPLLAGALHSAPVGAQSAPGAFTIVPSLSLQQTITSNRDLSPSDPRTDLITQISPGISISSSGGRVRGSLAYALNQIWYATDTQRNTVQNALLANLHAEAVENHGFVDASATISQQTISAFGTQSVGTGLVNSNSTEVSNLSVTPTWRSRIGSLADFNAGLNWSGTHSASTSLGDSTSHGGTLGLAGQQGLFGWTLTASRQVSRPRAAPSTTVDLGSAGLSIAPVHELQLSAHVGRSGQDVLTGQKVWSGTSGWDIAWQPTDRTQISYADELSYTGRSHNFNFSHRMARSVWTYSDNRSVNSSPVSSAGSTPTTLYTLLYNICLQGGGDAASCDQSVRSALAQQGLNPGSLSAGGFLSPGLTLQRSQNLAVSVSGLRTTITLAAFRTQTSPLGAVDAAGDLAAVSLLRQQGGSLTVSQRLSPTASLNATASLQKTLAAGDQPGNDQRLLLLTWTDQVGPHTNLALTARRTLFDSVSAAYNESALIGSLGFTF